MSIAATSRNRIGKQLSAGDDPSLCRYSWINKASFNLATNGVLFVISSIQAANNWSHSSSAALTNLAFTAVEYFSREDMVENDHDECAKISRQFQAFRTLSNAGFAIATLTGNLSVENLGIGTWLISTSGLLYKGFNAMVNHCDNSASRDHPNSP